MIECFIVDFHTHITVSHQVIFIVWE